MSLNLKRQTDRETNSQSALSRALNSALHFGCLVVVLRRGSLAKTLIVLFVVADIIILMILAMSRATTKEVPQGRVTGPPKNRCWFEEEDISSESYHKFVGTIRRFRYGFASYSRKERRVYHTLEVVAVQLLETKQQNTWMRRMIATTLLYLTALPFDMVSAFNSVITTVVTFYCAHGDSFQWRLIDYELPFNVSDEVTRAVVVVVHPVNENRSHMTSLEFTFDRVGELTKQKIPKLEIYRGVVVFNHENLGIRYMSRSRLAFTLKILRFWFRIIGENFHVTRSSEETNRVKETCFYYNSLIR